MDKAALGALVVSAIEQATTSPRRTDQVVKVALRRAPTLTNEERALVGRVVHGVRCWERTLALALAPLDEVSAAARAAAWCGLLDELPLDEAAALWPGQEHAWEAGRPERWRPRLPTDKDERLAIETSVPTWVAARLRAERGDAQARTLLLAMNEPGPVWLRANTLQLDRDALRTRLAEEGVTVQDGPLPAALRVAGRLNVRGSQAWQAGAFEVQDLGSQLIAAAVQAGPGATVIDVCAGRGGKTLALASALQGEGTLYAYDTNGDALDALELRAARAAARVAVRRGASVSSALADLEGQADRVLVDAPCSSLGTLRRGPDLRWRVSEADVADFAETQRAILIDAARLVRPGGRLVYATCSILAEENSDVVDAFEAACPQAEPAPLLFGEPFRFALQSRTRLGPHTDDTDGFFIAAWTLRV